MKYALPGIIVAVGIAVLSLLSPSNMPKVGFEFSDKAGHIFAYFVLSGCMVLFFFMQNEKKSLSLTTLFIIVASCSMYGILLESLQYAMRSGRYFEFPDIMANIFGAVLGTLLHQPIKTLYR